LSRVNPQATEPNPARFRLTPCEATDDIADVIYELTKEIGLPLVLTREDRLAIEAIVKRVA
jgi:hypothetical protein